MMQILVGASIMLIGVIVGYGLGSIERSEKGKNSDS